MKLRQKFNRGLVATFALGLGGAGYYSHELLQRNAEEEVLQNARIMMVAASSIRDYTAGEIRPLLKEKMETEFHPQSVPAYAATTNFETMSKAFPDYTYREATLNPTNMRNRPNQAEDDIIKMFRADKEGKVTELVTKRTDVNGNVLLSLSRKFVATKPCLVCHGKVDDAPKPMLAKYGAANGFGWMEGEIIGAQIVTVPMSVPLGRARHVLLLFIGSLAGIFGAIFLVLNLLLHLIVIRPVVKMAGIASAVSLGNRDAPEYVKPGDDEVASLSESFNRMRRSMDSALDMLEGDGR